VSQARAGREARDEIAEAFEPFERIAVLGLGLLGGSLAAAARRRGLARHVFGAGRRRAPLELALERGMVDEVGDVAEAVVGADLVVLATPVSSMPAVLEQVVPNLSPGALVTDVGSVKGPLSDGLPAQLPDDVIYIGSHPMAGSHLKGVEHAREDLFEGACCVITTPREEHSAAAERLIGFWRALGARVVERTPSEHDIHAAWVSHAPHLLAFAFAHSLGEAPRAAGVMAGSGFRDFTRIAGSDAELWGDILGANRKALTAPLQAFGRSLEEVVRALEAGDHETLERFLAVSRERLSQIETATEEGNDDSD